MPIMKPGWQMCFFNKRCEHLKRPLLKTGAL